MSCDQGTGINFKWSLGRFVFISWNKLNVFLNSSNRNIFYIAYVQVGSENRQNFVGSLTETCFIFEESEPGKSFSFQLTCYERSQGKEIYKSKIFRAIVGGNAVVRDVQVIQRPSCNIEVRWSAPPVPLDGYTLSVKKEIKALDCNCTFYVRPVINGNIKTCIAKSNTVLVQQNLRDGDANNHFTYQNTCKDNLRTGLSLDYVYGKIQATWGQSEGAESYTVFFWTSDLTNIKRVEKLNDTIYEFSMNDPFTYGSVVFCCVVVNLNDGTSISSKWETMSIVPIPPSNWEELKYLGSGQFGTVHLVRDIDYNCKIAKKTIQKSSLDNKQDDLSKEIHLMSMISHPRIIQYFGAKETQDAIHIFMEYMPGGSLRDVISDRSTSLMPEDRIKFYSRQILEGILYLHNQPKPVLHRDVKSLNVLIDSQGNAKLCDFGCSKLTEIQKNNKDLFMSLQHSGTSVGSPYWMSPEVIKNEGYGRLCDIWSVGCTIVEMFTGNPPWHEYDRMQAIYKIGSVKTEANLPAHASQEANRFLSEHVFVDKERRWYADQLLNHKWLRGGGNVVVGT